MDAWSLAEYPTYFRNDGKKKLRIFVYVRQLPEREKARKLTEREVGKPSGRYWSRTFCKVSRFYAHSAKSVIATCTRTVLPFPLEK